MMNDFDNFFMMSSNALLALPVAFAYHYHEWAYLFFAAGVFVFSPIYHWQKIKNSSRRLLAISKKLDVLFAIGAFSYMYVYVAYHDMGQSNLIFYTLLSLSILFFLIGKKINYKKLHPWFHILTPLISSAILIISHRAA